MLTDDEIVRRLADGEDAWVIDPEHGCTNPLTGYRPTAEVEAEVERRAAAADHMRHNHLARKADDGMREPNGVLTDLARRRAMDKVRLALRGSTR